MVNKSVITLAQVVFVRDDVLLVVDDYWPGGNRSDVICDLFPTTPEESSSISTIS